MRPGSATDGGSHRNAVCATGSLNRGDGYALRFNLLREMSHSA